MKVVVLKSRLGQKGGLEKQTEGLAKRFASYGHSVSILTSWKEERPPEIPGVEFVSLIKPKSTTLAQLIAYDNAVKKWLKHNSVDCVFGCERHSFQTHYRAGNGVHKVFLQRRHLIASPPKRLSLLCNPLHRLLLKYEKQSFEHRDLKSLFTNSEMVKQEILRSYSIDPQKICTIHNGVEWDAYAKPFVTSWQEKKTSEYRFLFIGNGYERKGLPFLLKALAELKSESWKLSVVGKDKNQKQFLHLAQRLGLEKRVAFYGPQTDLLPYYQNADSLVIPSLYDPFANVTLEALAMGLFVVSSEFNGGKEVLTNSSGAVIKDLFCQEAFKKALLISLAHPKQELQAQKRRDSIKILDFSSQLDKIVSHTIDSCT